ncbi:MAG: hypothetical protein JNM81_16780, partial [Rhodospirillaceae bacterium]|nr:hypothetical protein [Rhodospirillaceae bacterium]
MSKPAPPNTVDPKTVDPKTFDPKAFDPNAAFRQVVTLFQDNQLDDAVSLCRRVIVQVPQHPEVLHLLGLILYQQHKL